MRPLPSLLLALFLLFLPEGKGAWEKRELAGWTINVRTELLEKEPQQTAHALAVIGRHLESITRVVPAGPLAKLREVPLWVSPEYPGIGPRAEYHPAAPWLRENGRDPAMAKGVEFTNTRIIDQETRRMPVFVLHELAHAYHDRVLSMDHPGIRAAYERAKASRVYDYAEVTRGDGRPNRFARAYALTNEKEYFAETTEAFFDRNDFFPFTRDELAKVDPGMLRLLAEVWGVPAAVARPSSRVLHLLCWSEYVPPLVLEGFTARTGVRVVMQTYQSNDELLDRLAERPGAYDVVQPSQFYVEKLIAAKKLAPLDPRRLPNLVHLDPPFRGLAHDPENRFSVPWLAGTVGIVVDTARITEPVQTWAEVFSGKYAGRIVIVDDPREMVAWALATLGLPITDISDANLARVRPLLAGWLPQVKVFDSDSPKTALLRGDADVGIVWSGEAAALWEKDRRFQYVLPAAGAHLFLDSLAIPADAPEKALAEDFIDHCLDPIVSTLISLAFPYTNPNLAARQRLSPAQRENPASYPPNTAGLQPLRNVGNDGAVVNALVRELRRGAH